MHPEYLQQNLLLLTVKGPGLIDSFWQFYSNFIKKRKKKIVFVYIFFIFFRTEREKFIIDKYVRKMFIVSKENENEESVELVELVRIQAKYPSFVLQYLNSIILILRDFGELYLNRIFMKL